MKRTGTRRKRQLFVILLLFVLCIVVYSILSVWMSSNWLTVNQFAVSLKNCKSAVKVVVISDLHDHEFGKENQKLIDLIYEQRPDIVLMDGDMLNQDSDSSEVPIHLVEILSKEFPVYYAWGNHEIAYMENNHAELQQELEEAGAVVLEEKYEDITVRDQKIRIGGMYEYAFGTDEKTGENKALAATQEVQDFLKDFQNTDNLKLMMSHRPDSFVFGDASQTWDVDLVISGHNHGGQVVFPVLGGLYGGDQGWFPEYIHGLYRKDAMQLFVTSGLGSDKQILPRFNNRPEIAVLELQPEE